MLLIDGKHLRKRFVHQSDISKIYQDGNHIWPYITETIVGDWEVSLSASPTNVNAAGGTVKLTYTAKRVITYIWVNYDGKTYSFYKTQEIEEGVCTLGTTFGKLGGNILTIPSNPNNYDRVIVVTAHCGGVTKQITITQGHGSQGTSSSYIGFDCSTTIIPYDSNGEAVSNYIAIYNVKGALTYTDGSIYEESLDSTEYTASYSNTRTSENTEQTETLYLCTVTLTSPKYGSTSKTVTVMQEAAPKPVITGYGEWVLELTADKTTIPNSGGNVTATVNCYRNVKWSDGKTTVEQNTTPVILKTSKGTFSNASVNVSEGAKTSILTVGSNTAIKDVTITIEAACGNLTKSLVITQDKADNYITSTGNWVLTINANPANIGSAETDVDLTVNCYRKNTWADGSITTEQASEKVSVTVTSSVYSGSVSVASGASTVGVTIPENTSTQSRTYTASASAYSLTETATIRQAGVTAVDGDWELTLTASPTSLPQEGGTSSIYASCSRIKADGSIEYSSSNVTLSTTQGSLDTTSVSSSGGYATLTMGANDETYSISAIVKATCQGLSDTVYVNVAAREVTEDDEPYWQITYHASDIEADVTTNVCTVMFSKFSADGTTVLETVPATSASGVNIGSISSETGDNHLTVTWTGDANTAETSRTITFTATNDAYNLSGEVSFKQSGTVYEEPEGEWIATGAFVNITGDETTNSASNIGFVCWDGANFTDDQPLTSVSADIGTATITSTGDLCTVEWTGTTTNTTRTITITGKNETAGLTGTWKFQQVVEGGDGTKIDNLITIRDGYEDNEVYVQASYAVTSTVTVGVEIQWEEYTAAGYETGNIQTTTASDVIATSSEGTTIAATEPDVDIDGTWHIVTAYINSVSPESDDTYNYTFSN